MLNRNFLLENMKTFLRCPVKIKNKFYELRGNRVKVFFLFTLFPRKKIIVPVEC